MTRSTRVAAEWEGKMRKVYLISDMLRIAPLPRICQLKRNIKQAMPLTVNIVQELKT